jgi:protein required for attachment to host cells
MRDQNRKTWIVVADGGHARILLNTHRDEGVSELSLVNGHDPHLKGQNHGHVHHAPDHKPSPEKRGESHFLDQLADAIQSGVARKECEQVILVAPSTAMGHLRKALNSNAQKHIVAEVVHDYTHQTNDFIYKHVKDKIPF